MSQTAETQRVIAMTARAPTPWGISDDPDAARVLDVLQRRTIDTSPHTLAQLSGVPLKTVHSALIKLKRRGFAEPVARGNWASAR